MKREQKEFKVNLIGEQELSKLTKDEMSLLVAFYVDGLKKFLEASDIQTTDEQD